MTDDERSDFEWKKACEAEANFEKAVEMVTSIFFPKSEEDLHFVRQWIFPEFSFPKENESRENINPRLHP